MRILVHLAAVGPQGEEGTGKERATQEGIAAQLSTTQGAVSKVLSRLVAAEAVRRDVLRVDGRVRRVRVYSLTPRGDAIARSILNRSSGTPGLPPQLPR